jgi:hypothetical protein
MTSITDKKLQSRTSLITLVGFENVKLISDHAFFGCGNLETIPSFENVTSIDSCAFENCNQLETLPSFKKVTSIGTYAFKNCTKLTDVGFSNPDITVLNAEVFSGCTSLASVTGFENVVSIGDSAFYGCGQIKTLPPFESVKSIGANAFQGCTTLTEISFSDLLVTVGNNAFSGVPLRTLNFVGKKPGENEISRVCGLLSKGQSGSITTFNFSLGTEVLELSSPALETYIDGVLALSRPSLISNITSGTLDLCGAEIEIGSLSAPGTLMDTIKQGEQLYTWSGSAWTVV